MARVNVGELGLDTFSAKYNARFEKVGGDLQDKLCIVCGRTTGDSPTFVWIVDGGTSLASADETNVDSSADMGWWTVGAECIKKVPNEYRITAN